MKAKLKKLANPEVIKYLISGFAAFLIDIIVLNIFTFIVFDGEDKLIAEFVSLSKLVSTTIGISASFLFNRQWAFKATNGSVLPQVIRYLFVVLFNLVFATILYSFFIFVATQLSIPKELSVTGSNITTEAIKMVTSFFFYKYFVFKYNESSNNTK